MLKKVPKAKNYPEMGSKFLDMYILVVFKERKKIWDGTQKSWWVDVESPSYENPQLAQYILIQGPNYNLDWSKFFAGP